MCETMEDSISHRGCIGGSWRWRSCGLRYQMTKTKRKEGRCDFA